MNEAAAAATADVRFHRPAPPLSALVTAYYFVEVQGPPGAAIDDLLHPEWGNLRLRTGEDCDVGMNGGPLARAPGVALFGPTSRAAPIRVRPGTVIGVGFTPQGWARLIGIDASILADALTPAEAALPGTAGLHDRLEACAADVDRVTQLDAYFLQRLDQGRDADPRIDAILSALGDGESDSVEMLADRLGMSATQLSRCCRRWFGFTAKILLRRQRFLRTLARLFDPGERTISEVLDSAYCDQSHFNREFRRFMGLSPRAYFAGPRSILRPATRKREEDIGAALQGLHRAGQERAA